jgi:hypothetical protein
LNFGRETHPIESYCFGSTAEDAPVLGIIGGIHGLERIGTWVALSFLHYLVSRIEWDESLQWQLSRIRIFIIPIANPIGVKNFTRSNGNGVDLMRNSPVESENATWLVGGHDYTPKLPWFRGNPSRSFEGMELEAKAMLNHVLRQTGTSKLSLILDLHSGFGNQDQLWFPYAKSKAPFPRLPELFALKQLMDQVLPHHVYRFEPQSKNYTTHGDLWDYLCEIHPGNQNPSHILLPLTLEMGSWNWIRKNPVQLLSFLGPFNPIKPHRLKRTLRRHLPLFDFLIRTMTSPGSWSVPEALREEIQKKALAEWF